MTKLNLAIESDDRQIRLIDNDNSTGRFSNVTSGISRLIGVSVLPCLGGVHGRENQVTTAIQVVFTLEVELNVFPFLSTYDPVKKDQFGNLAF